MELEYQHDWRLPNPDPEPDRDSGHPDPDSNGYTSYPDSNSYTSYPDSNSDRFSNSHSEHDALQQRCDCGRRV